MPSTEEHWLRISEEYENKWNFPHCVGAIDGKHIQLQSPIGSGSDFFNYKSHFSIVLMALVDADYNFLYADVGCQGRISDGGVFKNMSLYKKLEANTLKLPPPKNLPGRDKNVPYVFVADEAFQLSCNIMKPYGGSQEKGSIKRSFNYRLSRSRRIVENAFGIVSSIFRVLRKPMLLEPDSAVLVVMACIHLHNFIRKNNTFKNMVHPPIMFDCETEGHGLSEGNWRRYVGNLTSFLPLTRIARRPSNFAEEIRQEFAEYFSNNGRVPWQADFE